MSKTFLDKIVHGVAERNKFIAILKSKSDYYPIIFEDILGDSTFYSTLVRIKRNDKWYVVHCVESFQIYDRPRDFYVKAFMLMLMNNVCKIQHLFIVDDNVVSSGFADLDKSQMDEAERIRKMVPGL